MKSTIWHGSLYQRPINGQDSYINMNESATSLQKNTSRPVAPLIRLFVRYCGPGSKPTLDLSAETFMLVQSNALAQGEEELVGVCDVCARRVG